mmetsp:Transcript_9807/g.9470  ORF Transcript_9807/g.9470 Transcript_9807/m.9470 type:complete len:107 (-) Transcript_9807:550-870(-)
MYVYRVLQHILEYCVESQKLRTLDDIMRVHRTLLDDHYGNYVIHYGNYVLQYKKDTNRDFILETVTKNSSLNLSRKNVKAMLWIILLHFLEQLTNAKQLFKNVKDS